MRLCRFEYEEKIQLGFYADQSVFPLRSVTAELGVAALNSNRILDLLPGGELRDQLEAIEQNIHGDLPKSVSVPISEVKLLVPIPDPPKLLLLAGNYSKHVQERGDVAEEREQTFPYVFMKPPSTTLTNPGDPVRIPVHSPDQIDWELELAVVIGRRCSQVSESEALDYVAGYTIINDISDRNFRPNPGRNERPRDKFFDWLHGKWHDTFCPCGPCIVPALEIPDPQQLKLQLKVNGEIEQDASTAEMVFPVAAVMEFISSFVTLEPGDIISTGTPDGVGKAKGKFLRRGDLLEASIEEIGVLTNPVM